MARPHNIVLRNGLFLLLSGFFTIAAHGGDGVIEINQAKALAGGVTSGDDEGFPVTISEPGSYRLTGPLTVPDENTTGIEIEADNVTIDLNGFAVSGPTECTGSPVDSCSPTGSGVGINAPAVNSLTVSNGVVSGMGASGILAVNGTGRILDVQAHDNGGAGIVLAGRGQIVRSRANGNGGSGMETAGAGVFESEASDNGSTGISFASGIVAGNVAIRNGGSGISGQLSGIVRDNACRLNGGWGLRIVSGGVGYLNNSFQLNTDGDVTGGTPLGNNICGSALCP